jgi:hypothetical protein
MLQVIEGGIGMRQEACVDYDVMVSGSERVYQKLMALLNRTDAKSRWKAGGNSGRRCDWLHERNRVRLVGLPFAVLHSMSCLENNQREVLRDAEELGSGL